MILPTNFKVFFLLIVCFPFSVYSITYEDYIIETIKEQNIPKQCLLKLVGGGYTEGDIQY